MLERNHYLVDHASALLAVYDGTRRSGTGAMVNYARKLDREIIIIDPITQQVTREGNVPSLSMPQQARDTPQLSCADVQERVTAESEKPRRRRVRLASGRGSTENPCPFCRVPQKTDTTGRSEGGPHTQCSGQHSGTCRLPLYSAQTRGMLWMLEQNPNIQSVCLCLDHDAAGIEANGRLTEILQQHGNYKVGIIQSKYKDWNEDIKALRGLPAQEAEEHPQLVVAPEICSRLSRRTVVSRLGYWEKDVPKLMNHFQRCLREGRMDKAVECMEQASAQVLGLYGMMLGHLGEPHSKEDLMEDLRRCILHEAVFLTAPFSCPSMRILENAVVNNSLEKERHMEYKVLAIGIENELHECLKKELEKENVVLIPAMGILDGIGLWSKQQEKERLINGRDDGTIPKTREFLEMLEAMPDFLPAFDGEIFGDLVEQITVEHDDRLRFRLCNGLTLTEQIERIVR